jgi:hypothetical protein
MIDLHWCLADPATTFPPEDTIFEEDLDAIRGNPTSCIKLIKDADGTELLKITCRPDLPVVYRVCELDFASLVYTLRFPD